MIFVSIALAVLSIYNFAQSIDPQIKLPNDFANKLNKILIDKQRNSSKVKHQNRLIFEQSDPLKEDHLKKFLSDRMQHYAVELAQIMIPELRPTIEKTFKIVKSNYKQDEEPFRIGVSSCQLTKFEERSTVPLCPWHWLIVERDHLYPFNRAQAKCNCKECKTKRDPQYTACTPLTTFTPALIRESLVNGTEKWSFGLEEVPTSCFCSIKKN